MSSTPESPSGSTDGPADGAALPTAGGPRRRLGRLERLAIEGVMTRAPCAAPTECGTD